MSLRLALESFTAELGISPQSDYQLIEEDLAKFCQSRGFTVRPDGFRKGILTVAASPATAYLLSFDKENLLQGLRERTGLDIVQLQVTISESG